MPILTSLIDRLAAMAERHLDLDAIMASATPLDDQSPTAGRSPLPPPGQRIALAHDQAFSFVYPHLIDGVAAAPAPRLCRSRRSPTKPPPRTRR